MGKAPSISTNLVSSAMQTNTLEAGQQSFLASMPRRHLSPSEGRHLFRQPVDISIKQVDFIQVDHWEATCRSNASDRDELGTVASIRSLSLPSPRMKHSAVEPVPIPSFSLSGPVAMYSTAASPTFPFVCLGSLVLLCLNPLLSNPLRITKNPSRQGLGDSSMTRLDGSTRLIHTTQSSRPHRTAATNHSGRVITSKYFDISGVHC